MDSISKSLEAIFNLINKSENHLKEVNQSKTVAESETLRDQREIALIDVEIKKLKNEMKDLLKERAIQETDGVVEEELLKGAEDEIGKAAGPQEEIRKQDFSQLVRTNQAVDDLVKCVSIFHVNVRLDDPTIISTLEELKSELKQMKFEEQSLECEIRLLEEDHYENESVKSHEADLAKETPELEKTLQFERNTEIGLKKAIAEEKKILSQLATQNERKRTVIEEETTTASEEADLLQANLAYVKEEIEKQMNLDTSLLKSTQMYPPTYGSKTLTRHITVEPINIKLKQDQREAATNSRNLNQEQAEKYTNQNPTTSYPLRKAFKAYVSPKKAPSTPKIFTRNPPPLTPVVDKSHTPSEDDDDNEEEDGLIYDSEIGQDDSNVDSHRKQYSGSEKLIKSHLIRYRRTVVVQELEGETPKKYAKTEL